MKLFVYGTLKSHYNHRLMAGLKLIGRDTLLDYTLYDLGSFPGMKQEDGRKVIGEVYEIDNEDTVRLQGLDSYEGYPYLYGKESVTTDGGHNCTTYVYNNTPPVGKEPREEWGITHVEES